MRKISFVPATLALAASLISCATVKPSEPVAEAVQAPPAPEPAMVSVPYWALNRVETAYPDGVISAVEEFTLDDTGRVLADTLYDGKGAVVSLKAYSWTGDTASVTMSDSSGALVGKGVQEWSNGLLVKETRLTPKDEIQSTEAYEYDAAGNKTHWSVQTAKGSSVTTDYFWTDGLLTGISVKDATGAEIKKFVRSYDASGLPLSEKEYDAKGTLVRAIAYTAENGFVTGEEVRNGTGGMVSAIQYENDENGNPVTVSFLDRAGRLIETRKQAWTGYTKLARQK